MELVAVIALILLSISIILIIMFIKSGTNNKELNYVPYNTTHAPPSRSQYTNYRIIRQIAKGGQSEVFLVDNNGSLCVKKIGEPNNFRLINEINLLRTFKHKSIIKYVDSGFITNKPFIILEYIPHPTLFESVSSGIAYNFEDIAKVIMELVNIHDFLWNECLKISHLDLKPSNLFVIGTGRDLKVILFDFGISARQEQIKGFVGTVPYMAPERLLRKKIDYETEIFEIGLIALYMLEGKSIIHINTGPAKTPRDKLAQIYSGGLLDMHLSLLDSKYEKKIISIIKKMLIIDPVERMKQFDFVRNELMEVVGLDDDSSTDTYSGDKTSVGFEVLSAPNEQSGSFIALKKNSTTRIGRKHSDCDVILHSNRISKVQMDVILRDKNKAATIMNLSDSVPITVNGGQPIPKTGLAALSHGDIVRLGDFVLKVCLFVDKPEIEKVETPAVTADKSDIKKEAIVATEFIKIPEDIGFNKLREEALKKEE